jgi:HlyD family secretion protein
LLLLFEKNFMDTYIKPKNKNKKYFIYAAIVFILLAFVVYNSVTKKKTLIVNADEISIKTVSKDYFEDFMIIQAKVTPLQSMLINIIEGGSVQEIFVENGVNVVAGQPLARLYNPNAELSYMQQETAIIEQINNLNKAKLDLRNQELNFSKDIVTIEHDYNIAKNLYDNNQKLFDKGIISKNEWTTTQESFRFQKERINIIKESVAKEKQANQIQIKQLNQSIGIMQKSLNILKNNKKNFLITAPLSGRLSSFEPVLGKTYTQGNSIGTIDVMKGYKLTADIDEFYLPQLALNLKGTVEYQQKNYTVVVTKIIPEIKNGRFQVELNFEDATIQLQQGLSFGVRLTLSEKKKTTVLSKGSFNQITNGKWIFVLENNKAMRRNIEIGRENPLYFEILKGLKPGEKVITSSYKDYIEVEEISFR